MKIFDGYRAWFSPSVPLAHINTWLADGGVQLRDPSKRMIEYYFSNSLDEQTLELLRVSNKVVYKSAWITDSSLSRTRQPLGAYAVNSRVESPRTIRRPQTVVSDWRGTTPTRGGSSRGARVQSVGEYDELRYRDDAQSVRSRCSSRHSNASSVVSYGRRQQVVHRFVIHADRQTQASILADVADFTPNSNGFVAYKIPKMT
ncbi:hypothetical protein IWW50_004889 [Coemansia erecta]|nr:hypothetical protein GGF43_006004 [Coemansia sp. RSA 2618]KAJ2820857.1 hypothetical protein IWW50_004889 [Coemansia erecta]